MDQLYFIALVPPVGLRETVKVMKEEMRDRFGAKHALKSPAHLTLQMPFRWPQEAEASLVRGLHQFAAAQTAIPVELSGFDCFAPRVIYVRVQDHEPLSALHRRLQVFLIRELAFTKDMVQARFHPHLTIATRDLRKPAFQQAWPEFRDRPFTASFVAESLFLLKHNGRFWDLYRELTFDGRLRELV